MAASTRARFRRAAERCHRAAALGRVVEDGNRAADVIGRIRALIKKEPPRKERLGQLNQSPSGLISHRYLGCLLGLNWLPTNPTSAQWLRAVERRSLSDWLASNRPLLETHFGLPESVIAKFSEQSVFIVAEES
jgi:hypothetical protein